jgi:hypothetical protein
MVQYDRRLVGLPLRNMSDDVSLESASDPSLSGKSKKSASQFHSTAQSLQDGTTSESSQKRVMLQVIVSRVTYSYFQRLLTCATGCIEIGFQVISFQEIKIISK